MYEFIDTKAYSSSKTPEKIDDDLLLFSTRRYISTDIPAFKVVKINGVNDYKKEIDSTEFSGDGAYFSTSRIPSKEIEVEFILDCSTQEQLIQSQRKLIGLLSTERIDFTFKYLIDWKYSGVVTSIEFESGVLNPSGKIIIFCDNPYRIREKKGVIGQNLEGIFIEIKKIKFTILGSSGKGVIISSGNSKIKILDNTTIPSDARYELTWLENKGFELRVSGRVLNNLISPESNIGTFKVPANGRINLNVSSSNFKDTQIIYNEKEMG